jgi:hypothetical protein
MKSLHILLSTMFLMVSGNPGSLAQGPTSQAGAPRISNLKFSANPVTPGIKFTISFEFEGDVDRLFIENTYETQSDEIKREIKEYSIPSEIKAERKGIVSRQWETQKGSTHKLYRILSVWVKDTKGNQSNVLSGEVKIVSAMPANLRDAQWLLGSWTGILPGKEKTRTLKINEDKDGVKALYGITDEKMDPIALSVDGNEVSFTTLASTQITLKQVSERRMDGLFQPKGDSKPRNIRFWKDGEIADVDSRLKAFSGTWQGEHFWEGSPYGKPDLVYKIKVKVAYIDSIAAAVLRENGEFMSLDGFLNNANWAWCHANVTPKTIEFPFWHPRGVFVCELSSDGKYLQGKIKGLDGFQFSENSFKLKRVDN